MPAIHPCAHSLTLLTHCAFRVSAWQLITGPLVTKVGGAHNKTGAQVSLHWTVRHGVPVSTKSTSAKHLSEDLDIFEWDVTDAELDELDTASSPAGHPSFMCNA